MDAGIRRALVVDGDLNKGWDSRSRQPRVLVLSLEAVSTDTQYFGPGTRLTVLGKFGASDGVGEMRNVSLPGFPGNNDQG